MLENLALLGLTAPAADVPALLAALHFRTWVKWELLATASALFAAGFIGSARPWVNGLAALMALTAMAGGVLGAVDPASFSPLMAYSIAAVWLWQLVYTARAAFAGRNR